MQNKEHCEINTEWFGVYIPLTSSRQSAKWHIESHFICHKYKILYMKLYIEQYSLNKGVGRWTTYIWVLYSEQQFKGNWYAYIISKKHILNRIKVLFLLIVQISGQREHRRKKKRGRDGINNGNWCIYLWVTGAGDWVFQSQINWLNKCSTHTHRWVCIRPLVALQSYLRSFPMEEWINRY